ncbi:MAG: TetR/AcrR family transcriptional regulator [Pseudomonadales bacterium]|nr:TetR/AcrR family transcriptional regulator [Pseudomonadales bacterium]
MTPKDSSYHHGALREALLEAGDELLRERGYTGFTLRECARRAGVSHAAPKHHFGDVQNFLSEIAANGFRRLTDRLRDEIGKARNLDEEFIATTRAYVGFAEENPEHFRLMFRRDLLNESDSLVDAVLQTYTVLTNVILRQRAEPEITQPDLSDRLSIGTLIEDILIGWSHIHGFANLQLEDHLKMIPEEKFQSLLEKTAVRVSRTMRPTKG